MAGDERADINIMYEFDTSTLVLAQGPTPPPPDAGAIPLPPGGGQPLTGSTPAGGPATGGTGRSDGFGGNFFVLMLLMVVVMITFTMLGSRRDRKKRKTLLASIRKHDRVQTVGGVIGFVVEVNADTVVLKVDETANTRITFARTAIQQVLTDGAVEPKMGTNAAQ